MPTNRFLTALIRPLRIQRLSFAVRVVVSAMTWTGALYLNQAAFALGPQNRFALALAAIALVLSVFALFFFLMSTVYPRVKDLGLHGAFTVLIAVPAINVVRLFVLLLAPSGRLGKSR